ncbi:hypothetical protein WK78_26655 [Burkholderia cepacia]|nr:hypothetical protein WK78_26655 [Burkholderia cepacia]
MTIREEAELFTDEIVESTDIDEVSKIIGAHKYYNKCREHIIVSTKYTAEQKLVYMNILDANYKKENKQVKSSNYDNKPYCITFFEDFTNFLCNNNLSQNELKLCMAIYRILNKQNAYGNVLLNYSNETLASYTNINITNISRTLKGLCDKGLIKKEGGTLALNYNFFFRGNKVEYDNYTERYENMGNE